MLILLINKNIAFFFFCNQSNFITTQHKCYWLKQLHIRVRIKEIVVLSNHRNLEEMGSDTNDVYVTPHVSVYSVHMIVFKIVQLRLSNIYCTLRTSSGMYSYL